LPKPAASTMAWSEASVDDEDDEIRVCRYRAGPRPLHPNCGRHVARVADPHRRKWWPEIMKTMIEFGGGLTKVVRAETRAVDDT